MAGAWALVSEGQGATAVDINASFEKVFPHHDLLIEIGKVEMAMETLQRHAEQERAMLQPRLESRIVRLRTALQSLPA